MEVKNTPLQLYYVAVGSSAAKLDTLVELIRALREDESSRSLAVCCGSRDCLDSVTRALKERVIGRLNVWCMHADLSDREILTAAEEFREAALVATQTQEDNEGDLSGPLHILLTTDSSIQVLCKIETEPLAPTLIIHYDLPIRKEEYSRRSSIVLGSRSKGGRRRIGISFAEAGKIDQLHLFEEFAERSLREMPVHVTDIFTNSNVQTT